TASSRGGSYGQPAHASNQRHRLGRSRRHYQLIGPFRTQSLQHAAVIVQIDSARNVDAGHLARRRSCENRRNQSQNLKELPPLSFKLVLSLVEGARPQGRLQQLLTGGRRRNSW